MKNYVKKNRSRREHIYYLELQVMECGEQKDLSADEDKLVVICLTNR